MASVILLAGLASALHPLSYEGPREVVRFSERETNGLGFIREGAGHGPLRLLVSDTAMYLLARLDHKFYVFDFYGKVLDSLLLDFCPADVTYDSQGAFHLLQCRVEPAFVTAYFKGERVEMREFELPEYRVMNEICFSPSGERLLISGGFTYKLAPGAARDVLIPAGERPGRFYLTDSHIARTGDGWRSEFTGKTAQASVSVFQLDPRGWELFQFHSDDRAGRIYIVGTSLKEDEEGEKYVARRLLVEKDGQLLAEIEGIEAGDASYDYANHDIAVAPSGDVYLWRTHLEEGYSQILCWKAKE